MRKIFLTLALAALACSAFPQGHSDQDDAPLYEGVWNVRFEGRRSARFELHEWSGTWRETGAQHGIQAACRGRKFPVSVHHSTGHALEFTVWGSSVNPACPDTLYVFKPRDAKTLDAALDAGGKVTMVRVAR